MTPAELAVIVQEAYLDESPDVIGDPDAVARWTRSFLLREIGTAQRQACLRQDLKHLYDTETAALCAATLVAGTSSYTLDSRVLRIERVSLDGIDIPHVTRDWLDRARPYWRDEGSGTPLAFYVTGRTLSLFPKPDAAGTLNLEVWRLPLADPNWNDDLEWPGEQEPLAHWVAHRAFLRPNEATFSAEFAKTHLELFEQAYGKAVSERVRADLLANPGAVQLLSKPPRWWEE